MHAFLENKCPLVILKQFFLALLNFFFRIERALFTLVYVYRMHMKESNLANGGLNITQNAIMGHSSIMEATFALNT